MTGAPLQQARAGLLLQTTDGVRERRLRDVNSFPGPGDVPLIDTSQKIPQIA